MVKFSDVKIDLLKDDDYILLDDTIFDVFDRFTQIIHSNKGVSFMTYDFEIVKFINESLDSHIYNPISLIDDGQLKDRSYIRKRDYSKINRFGIPLSYAMWNPEFDSYIYTHFAYKDNGEPTGLPFVDRVFWMDYLSKISRDLDDLDDLGEFNNIFQVSSYVQDRIQYVGDNVVTIDGFDYIFSDDQSHKIVRDASKLSALLNDRYGTCTGISAYTMLLLNNPKLKVNCRILYNSSHAWNFVYYDGSVYLSDNALNIISGDIDDNLMNRSFNSKYVLFGQDRELPVHRVFDNNLFDSDDINTSSVNRIISHNYGHRDGHFKVLKVKHEEE